MIVFQPVIRNLSFGSCPSNTVDVRRIKRGLGITAIFNLQTDDDLQEYNIDWSRMTDCYQQHGIQAYRYPVMEFDDVDLEMHLPRIVSDLKSCLDDGHRVYVHCNQGQERAPSVVVAYMHWHCQLNLDNAVEKVNKYNSCSPKTDVITRAQKQNLQTSASERQNAEQT